MKEDEILEELKKIKNNTGNVLTWVIFWSVLSLVGLGIVILINFI